MKKPVIDETVFRAPDAVIYGDVTIEAEAGIWFHAVVRAEHASIRVGRGSNIQDNAVVHVDEGRPVVIGENVTVGHGAILHGCRVGDNTLIGMGAIVLNGAVIGKNCIVGAGAVVTQNTVIPDGTLVLGNPARIRRPVTRNEMEENLRNARLYVEEGKKYAAFLSGL